MLYSRVITYSSSHVAPAHAISFLLYGSLTVFTSLVLLIVEYQTWNDACSCPRKFSCSDPVDYALRILGQQAVVVSEDTVVDR